MSETKIVCKAKNPANCRYHTPSSISTLANIYNTSRSINESLVETYRYLSSIKSPKADEYINAILKSKLDLEKAEVDYYSTPEGEDELQTAIDDEEDLNSKMFLESKQRRILERKAVVEAEGNFEEYITPSRTPLFTLPVFKKVNLAPKIELWTGNKYSSTHTVQRIREFVKKDLKHARQLGFLPEGATYVVKSDNKTKSILVEIHNAPEGNEELLKNRVGKMVKAYATATVYRNTDSPEETQTSFNLFLKTVEKPSET